MMQNKLYKKNLFFYRSEAVVFISFILVFASFGVAIAFEDQSSQTKESHFSIIWEVQLNFNEPGGAYTNNFFGEGPDASDGQDSYDTPMSPPPMPPYIRSWFNTNLSQPYHQLWEDYRHYPDTYKVWNLSVQWVPTDYSSPTSITISWSNVSVNTSEYDFVFLYNSTSANVANMLVSNSYTFSCPALALQNFQIICNKDLNSPEITNNSPGNGETGDSYTFNATVTDNLADASSLLVKVDWSHGSLSGNDTMSNIPGTNYFTKEITLDQSTSSLKYHFYAQDNAKVPNTNYTSELSANIFDDEYPIPISDDTTITLTTGDPITFGLTITDNIDVNYVYTNYRWKQGSIWGSWNTNVAMSEGLSNNWVTSCLSTPSDATDVNYYFEVYDNTFTVYIYSGSLLVTDNEVIAQSSPFSKVITDNDPPSIVSITGDTSGTTGETTTISVTFSDNIGVTVATLYYKTASAGVYSSKSILSGSAGIDIPLNSVESWYYYVTVDDAAGTGPVGSPSVDGSIYWTVTVTDNDPPLLSDIAATPSTQITDGYINITATATDNININTIKVDIIGPTGFTPINASMTQNGGNVFYYYNNYSIVGTYNYSIWVSDGAGNGVTSAVYQFVIIAEIKVSNLIYKWNFVSLPINQSVNKNDLFVIYSGSRYTWSEAVGYGYVLQFIYGWNRTTHSYNGTNILYPGEGYWIYVYHNMELWVTGIGPITPDNYITPLKTQWNIVGVPANQTVNKTNLIINYGGTNYNWSQAVTNGYVLQFVYGWSRTTQNYQGVNVLEAGECYWMYAYVDCVLKWEMS